MMENQHPPNPEIDISVSSPRPSSRLSFDFGELELLDTAKPPDRNAAPPPPPPPDHDPALSPSAQVRMIHSSGDSSPRTPPPFHSPSPHLSDVESGPHSRSASRDTDASESEHQPYSSTGYLPVTGTLPRPQQPITHAASTSQHQAHAAVFSSTGSGHADSPQNRTRHSSRDSTRSDPEPATLHPALQYHHDPTTVGGRASTAELQNAHRTGRSNQSGSASSSIAENHGVNPGRYLSPLGSGPGLQPNNRPSSSYSTLSLDARERESSPHGSSRDRSRSGRSPDSRPISYVDLLTAPYPQPAPAATNFNNTHLQTAVGANASLLSNRKTLEMYRANAKKTNDASVQYEFALFMISAANEASAPGDESSPGRRDLESPFVDNSSPGTSRAEMLKEARQILQKLSDRSYPFAQYYLADGYASGLFSKGKEDYDKAFPLFMSASKHGHAEAGYRAALCYEFGWGCRRDPPKAVQFYRHSASKNHPGAMTRLGKACLVGDLGLGNRYREGLKWLKRATESADPQYNRAPYELGLLYETGYGEDVFRDEGYAAQLFTQAAELGHAEASYRLGDAYEHGKLSCPRDPALSVHFYNGAAQQGHPAAMMALCAWYIVGAEPVLSKDDNEAYQWAKQAAELGLAKAEYAVGYFTEMGIGCRRDPLEANMWYVRAADQGDERATHRLQTIRAAASGEKQAAHPQPQASSAASVPPDGKARKGSSTLPSGGPKDEKECIIM